MFDTEKFISVIKKRPSIWDPWDENYSDGDAKIKAWDEVAAKMDPEWVTYSSEQRTCGGELEPYATAQLSDHVSSQEIMPFDHHARNSISAIGTTTLPGMSAVRPISGYLVTCHSASDIANQKLSIAPSMAESIETINMFPRGQNQNGMTSTPNRQLNSIPIAPRIPPSGNVETIFCFPDMPTPN